MAIEDWMDLITPKTRGDTRWAASARAGFRRPDMEDDDTLTAPIEVDKDDLGRGHRPHGRPVPKDPESSHLRPVIAGAERRRVRPRERAGLTRRPLRVTFDPPRNALPGREVLTACRRSPIPVQSGSTKAWAGHGTHSYRLAFVLNIT